MQKKTTDELLHEISISAHPEDYLEQNQEELLSGDISQRLGAFLRESGRSKAEVIRRSGLNRVYAYQLFLGRKIPSRDKVIALAFGMMLSGERTQKLLKAVGYRELYVRDPRDAVLFFGLQKSAPLVEVNEQLFELGLPIIE